MSAPDHRKRVRTGKIRGARQFGDGFLTGIDEIRILFAFEGVWTNAEQSILRLQQHFHTLWNVVRAQRGHSDAKIHGETVFQLARNSPRDDFTFWKLAHSAPLFLTVRF